MDHIIALNDYGWPFITTLVDSETGLHITDLASVSSIKYIFTKPDDSSIEKTGLIYLNPAENITASDGKVTWIIEPNTLDQQGIWTYRVRLEYSAQRKTTTLEGRFIVK